MDGQITPQDTGVSVFGVKQMAFEVDGQTVDFSGAVSAASIEQAMTVERNAQAVAGVVKLRMRKLEDLGKVLALVADALAQYTTKEPKSSDTVDVHIGTDGEKRFKDMQAKLKKYGINMDFGNGTKSGSHGKTSPDYSVITLRRDTAMRAQSNIQQMMDKEDNDLQQDRLTLQGFVSKTNKSYETSATMVNKVGKTGDKVIANIGG